MNENEKLTPDEKKILKNEIKIAFDEFPKELQQRILDVKKEKLKTLYMIEGWSKDNGHQTIVDLISRKIAHKEEKIAALEKKLNS